MRHAIAAGTVAAAILCVASCGRQVPAPTETTTSLGRTSVAPAGTVVADDADALVRFVNADPEGKGRAILAHGEPLFSGIEYKQTTPYLAIPRSVEEFELQDADTSQRIAVSRRALLIGRHYTLVALPRERFDSRLAVMQDNLYLLEPGRARVRLVNATLDVDELDLYAVSSQKTVLHGVDPATATSFVDVDAGTFEVHPRGQLAPPQLANLPVEADRVYTFVVVGDAADLELVRIEDDILAMKT